MWEEGQAVACGPGGFTAFTFGNSWAGATTIDSSAVATDGDISQGIPAVRGAGDIACASPGGIGYCVYVDTVPSIKFFGPNSGGKADETFDGGASPNAYTVAETLASVTIDRLYNSGGNFIVTTTDGGIISFGSSNSAKGHFMHTPTQNSERITQVSVRINGFSALKADGTVICVSDAGQNSCSNYQPTSTGDYTWTCTSSHCEGLSDIASLWTGEYCTAAITTDGKVWAWGQDIYNARKNSGNGNMGNINGGGTGWLNWDTRYGNPNTCAAAPTFLNSPLGTSGAEWSPVVKIFAYQTGWAALKADGSVWPWGDIRTNGPGMAQQYFACATTLGASDWPAYCNGPNQGTDPNPDPNYAPGVIYYYGSTDGRRLFAAPPSLTDPNDTDFVPIFHIYSRGTGFAAVTNQGRVITWGTRKGTSSEVPYSNAELGDITVAVDGTFVPVPEAEKARWPNYGVTPLCTAASCGAAHPEAIVGFGYDFVAIKTDGSIYSTIGSADGTNWIECLGGGRAAAICLNSDGKIAGFGDNSYGANVPAGLRPGGSSPDPVCWMQTHREGFSVVTADGGTPGDCGSGGTVTTPWGSSVVYDTSQSHIPTGADVLQLESVGQHGYFALTTPVPPSAR